MNENPEGHRINLRAFPTPNLTKMHIRRIIDLTDYLSGKTETDHPDISKLTQGELDVFFLIALGLISEEIAQVLKLGQSTVEDHKHNLERKIGTQNTAELTKIAIRTGLVSL